MDTIHWSPFPKLPVSAGAVELRNAVASAFGMELPATVAFDHPTIGAMAQLIAGSGVDGGNGEGEGQVVHAPIVPMQGAEGLVGIWSAATRAVGGVAATGGARWDMGAVHERLNGMQRHSRCVVFHTSSQRRMQSTDSPVPSHQPSPLPHPAPLLIHLQTLQRVSGWRRTSSAWPLWSVGTSTPCCFQTRSSTCV